MNHFDIFVHARLVVALFLLAGSMALWPRRRRNKGEAAVPSAASLAESGLGFALLGRLSEALARFEQARAQGLEHAALYYNWGLTLSHQGDHEGAVAMYARSVELDPACVDAIINSGVSLAALDRHQDACERYERALELDPDSAASLFNWGCSLIQLNRLEAACVMFSRAAALSPPDPHIHYNWAICLRRRGRNDEAAEHLRTFLDLARNRFPEQVSRANELLGEAADSA